MARIVFRQSRPPDPPSSADQSESSWRQTIAAGSASNLAVAAAAVWQARTEGQSGWRSIHAISHIVWGPRTMEQQRFTARYIGSGLLLNAIACAFWAWLYYARRRSKQAPVSLLRTSGRGIGISALAYVTDYYLLPRRFTPGFELSLSRRNCPWLYGALAAGLIIPEWLALRRRDNPRATQPSRQESRSNEPLGEKVLNLRDIRTVGTLLISAIGECLR